MGRHISNLSVQIPRRYVFSGARLLEGPPRKNCPHDGPVYYALPR